MTTAIKAAPVAHANCDRMCTFIYNPVCAQLPSGKNQTFGNPCTLGIYNCEHPNAQAQIISESACEGTDSSSTNCDIGCTMEYGPVCATSNDGKHNQTFSNACMLTVYNCKNPNNLYSQVSGHACDKVTLERRAAATSSQPSCDIDCTMEYDPVCAISKDGKHSQIFGNKCELSVYNCKNPTNPFHPTTLDDCPTAPDGAAVPETSARSLHDLPKRQDLITDGGENDKCGNMCMMVIDPVCGRDKQGNLRAFNNSCLLSQYKCKHPNEGLELVADKSCFLL
ncbi:hypothetical protein FBU30_001737 [Linnemannia zychae]|nr:hypothetical protein FBU30_001737 [Linnemannia zychae]